MYKDVSFIIWYDNNMFVLNLLKKYNMLNLMSPSHSIDHTTGFSILNRLHNRLEREVDCSAKVM